MKKILSRLLVLLLVAILLVSPVSAAHADLEKEIINSCRTGQQINLTAYDLTEESLADAFWELSDSGALPWYAASSYRFTYDQKTGQIQYLIPEPLPEDQYDRTLYEKRIAEVMAETVFPGMTPVQIALSVHDYLISHCIYDETLEKNTGYDLLVNGSTVCAGYARAYMEILTRAGIPCRVVDSEEMNHAWNLVQIDGSWYHVDLTWDDPAPDTYGLVRHSYFLLTDEEMLSEGEEGHFGWDTDITCTDTRFQDGFWRDIESQISYDKDLFSYYQVHDDWDVLIRRRDSATGKAKTLYTDQESYIDIGRGQYTYYHLGLTLWNGRLYGATQTAVYSMKTDGSDRKTEYRYDYSSNQTYILGCFVDQDTLYLTLSDHDGNESKLVQPLAKPTGYHQHSYTETVVPATCELDGLTKFACGCGLQVEAAPVAASGHSYASTILSYATFYSEGTVQYRCSACDHTYTEPLPTVSFFRWLINWFIGKYA